MSDWSSGVCSSDLIDSSLGDRLQPLPVARWLASGRRAEPMLDVASPVNAGMRLSLRLIPYSDELWLLVARDVTKVMRLEQMPRDLVAKVSPELRHRKSVVSGKGVSVRVELGGRPILKK